MQLAQYFAGRIGWLSTYKKHTKYRYVILHAADIAYFPGIPFGQVCDHSSSWMVIAQSVDGLMEDFLSERKENAWCLLQMQHFGFKIYFFIKNFEGKDECCVVVFECSRKQAFSALLQNK